MKRLIFFMLCIVSIVLLIGMKVAADTMVLSQRIKNCVNGEDLTGTVVQGDKIEANLEVLVTTEKEIVLYSQLKDVMFYLDEDKISENNTVVVTLLPGTHNIRAVGKVPTGVDGQKIMLISSDNIAKYITATLSSPYFLKTTAYAYTITTGMISALIASLLVFTFSKNKVKRMKTKITKESEQVLLNTRRKLKDFFRLIAPHLNDIQKKEAKKLLQELEEVK